MQRLEPWVIIDGDCAFCTSSTEWLAARLHRADRPDIRRVPYQFVDLTDFGLTEDRTKQEMIWVPAGEPVPAHLVGGSDAFAAWLRYAGGPYAIAGTLIGRPPVRPLAKIIYRLVAANRQRLPGGTPACGLPQHYRP
jgi:predicted DCC family thiol-disulfide oxidoreductase YuxK